MKILVFSTNGIMNDGITAWIRATYAAMDLKGLDVSTIAFEGCDQELINQVNNVGIHVHLLPDRKKNLFAYMRSFRSLLMEKKYDVVHACGNSATMSFELYEAKRAGVKIRIAHSHNTMCQHRLIDKMLRPFFYHFTTTYYACGNDAGKWLFGNHEFKIIPNGKDLDAYAFSENVRIRKRHELGISDNTIAIGHVGRFNNQKNHKKLITIFNELLKDSKQYHLFLIGDGELIDSTKKIVNELEIKNYVSFLGRRTDVPQILNAMDCMVFPSLYEGFPNVILEWQLNGLPVVMSDSITDECAITPLVQQVSLEDDSSSWVKSIKKAIMMKSNRFINSVYSRKCAKKMGYDIKDDALMLRRLYFCYKNAI